MIFAVLFTSAHILLAQKIVSITAAPGLTVTNLKREDNFYSNDFRNANAGASAGLSLAFGASADLPLLTERLYFSTGILYAAKNFALDLKTPIRPLIYNPETQVSKYMLVEHDPRYLIHYIQLPATFKVFTNPISEGGRFYFQAGSIVNFKVAEQPIDKANNYLYQLSQRANGGNSVFKSFDIGLYGAFGYQWKLHSGRFCSAAISVEKGLRKQLNPIDWDSESAPIDYYINARLVQIAIACNYSILKN